MNKTLVVLGAYGKTARKKRILATIEYLRKHQDISKVVLTGGKTR